MKKMIIALCLLSFTLTSCFKSSKSSHGIALKEDADFKVVVIDSCEYIMYETGTPGNPNYVFSLTHKGNCKYCASRKK